jgi:hypothetical protein
LPWDAAVCLGQIFGGDAASEPRPNNGNGKGVRRGSRRQATDYKSSTGGQRDKPRGRRQVIALPAVRAVADEGEAAERTEGDIPDPQRLVAAVRVIRSVQVRFAGKDPRRLLDIWNPAVQVAPHTRKKPVDVDGSGPRASLFDAQVAECLP